MSTASKTISKMARAVDHRVDASKALKEHCVDGIKPRLLVIPGTEEQLAQVVRLAGEGDVVLVPVGAEHQVLDIRRAQDTRPIVLVSTRGLTREIAYSEEDLILTVESGLTLAQVDQLANQYEQHLPVDPPHAETSTLGGVVATAASGPRSLLHGSIEAYILGGSMVLATGEIVRSGAKTTKNVAGYDLHKLLIGSYGSLGIITQLDLKLKPVPEDFRLAEILAETIAEALYITGQLVRGQTRPSMITLFNRLSAQDLDHELDPDQVLIRVGYEDSTETVEWQVTHVHTTYGEKLILLDTQGSIEEYKHMVEWPTGPCNFSFEAIVRGGHLETFLEYCGGHDIAVMNHASTGVVLGRSAGDLSVQTAAALRQSAGEGSSVKFIRLPDNCRVPRWSGVGHARRWMAAVKGQFDPANIFPYPGFLGA